MNSLAMNRIWIVVGVLSLSLGRATWAVDLNPSETAMSRALRNADKSAISDILIQWIRSGRDGERAAAAKHLNTMNSDYHSAGAEAVKVILTGKFSAMYDDARRWLESNPSISSGSRDALVDLVMTRVSDDPKMKASVQKMFVKNPKGEIVLAVPASSAAFRFAQAAVDAGGPPEWQSAVRYGNAPDVKYTGEEQFHWDTFPDWVLANNQSALFPLLESQRQAADPAKPERATLTKMLLAYAENAEPAMAREMRKAIRNSLVKNEEHRFKAADDKNSKYSTLTVNLGDESDLKLARMLDKAGDEWVPGKAGLSDVQMVNWNKPAVEGRNRTKRDSEVAVTYPTSTQVLPGVGQRLSDIIAEKIPGTDKPNFIASPSGALARSNDLLERSQVHDPQWRSVRGSGANIERCADGDRALATSPAKKSP